MARQWGLRTAAGIIVIVVASISLTGFLVAREASSIQEARVDSSLATGITQMTKFLSIRDGRVRMRFAGDDASDDAGMTPMLQTWVIVTPRGSAGRLGASVLFRPYLLGLPSDLPVRSLAQEAAAQGTTAVTVTAEGRPFRLEARPVARIGERSVVVLAAQGWALTEAAHTRLIRWIWLICVALAVAGALGAFALVRLVLRPMRGLITHDDRLMASAVHEVRRPLARLRGVSEAALLGDEDPKVALRRAERAAIEVSETIDDLTDLARLARGHHEVQLEPLRLDVIVREALDHRWPEENLSLDLEPTIIEGSSGLLRRAVLNLVENAWRHGRHHGRLPRIEVMVRHGRVVVADDGPGAEPGHLDRVIVNAWGSSYLRGSGLGLKIVGLVVRAHRGELTATNRPEGGLAVVMAFPCLPLTTEPVGPAAPAYAAH